MNLLTALLNAIIPEAPEVAEVKIIQGEQLLRLVQIREYKTPGGITVRSVFPYRHKTIRALIWALKYRSYRAVLPTLIEGLQRVVHKVNQTLPPDPVLIPIPLAQKRLRERGFNQAEVLTKAFCKAGLTGTLNTKALTRVRETTPQAQTLDRKERLKNMRGAFEVSMPTLVEERNIILIDDISTTGATLDAAAEPLFAAKARTVTGLVLSH